jgi:hypothetical protein
MTRLASLAVAALAFALVAYPVLTTAAGIVA